MRKMLLLLILLGVMAGSSIKAQEPPADKPATQPAAAVTTAPALTQEQVVAEIKKCGGTVKREGNSLDGPVVHVVFYGTNSEAVTDAGLEHLKGFNQLQYLSVTSTKVTAQGVKMLQEALPKCQIKR